MFIGQHVCELDRKGRFTIPEPYREILARGAEDERAVCFAAAETLRVYSQSSLEEYVAQMRNQPEGEASKVALNLLHFTLTHGLTCHSRFGLVVIPEVFRHRYWLFPGMRLTLQGCGDYFLIDQWRDR